MNYLNKCYMLIGWLFLMGCTDLVREEYSRIESDDFFQTEADCKAAVTDLYSGNGMIGWFATGGAHIGALSDLTANHTEFAWNSGWGWDASHYLYTADKSYWMNDRYNLLVQGVSKATTLLERIKNVPMKDETRARYMAEVRALRCNMIFWGADVYNGISIMDDPEELADISGKAYYRPRATQQESMDYINAEVEEIIDDLPPKYAKGDADFGRMTQGALLTIQLKMLMQQHQYKKAEEVARKITEIGYGLVHDYEQIFTIENEMNEETILSYPCVANQMPGNQYQAHWLTGNYPNSNPGSIKWGVYKLKWHFIDSFDPEDDRLNLIVQGYTAIDGKVIERGQDELTYGGLVLKYNEDPAAAGFNHGNDMIMFRYADVLLLLAEAIAENNGGPTQEAIDLVNQIRRRAFPDHPEKLYELTDFQGNLESFRNALLDERGWELYAEFVRRQDLIRFGKFDEEALKVNENYTPGKKYFPIPNWIVHQSGGVISQNAGY